METAEYYSKNKSDRFAASDIYKSDYVNLFIIIIKNNNHSITNDCFWDTMKNIILYWDSFVWNVDTFPYLLFLRLKSATFLEHLLEIIEAFQDSYNNHTL